MVITGTQWDEWTLEIYEFLLFGFRHGLYARIEEHGTVDETETFLSSKAQRIFPRNQTNSDFMKFSWELTPPPSITPESLNL